MTTPEITLAWSAVFRVAPKSTKTLPGDKILLPQSALEQLLAASTVTVTSSSRPANATTFDPFNPYSLAAARAEQSQWRDTQQQLPHPLTFRLVNTKNGNVVHAGIREFSADEGEIGLSPFLLEALGVKAPKAKTKSESVDSDGPGTPDLPIDLTDEEEDVPQITVHAKQLPKGTYVRLRPLEAGYNPEDWKSLLERHLRENFTTLTNGEILTVRGSKSEEFRFLIDKFTPEGDGICVVDTDLEVDIEALNEEQARETLKQILAKAQKAPGSAEGSSVGGDLNIWKPSTGQVLDGDYVDFRLPSWDRSQGIDIELTTEEGSDVELFVSPYSPHQRAKPREDEHVFGDFSSQTSKRIVIQPSNVELDNAEALFVSVHAHPATNPAPSLPHMFSLRVKSLPKEALAGGSNNPVTIGEDAEMHSPDEEKCKNCQQWIPKRTMMLHENFCLRNNILCPHCQTVFQKRSEEWANHWHCDQDSEHGNTPTSKTKHDEIFHTARPCPNCMYKATNLRDLASHRTSICPGKIILCQFCHLEVPQEGDPFDPSPEALISGLTAHELADGARTTDCHLCSKIIRLRDMATHLRHHEMEKSSRSKPTICRNVNCGRTLHGVGKNGEIGAGSRMGQGPGNDLGLCSICFGPLYVSMHDPEGRALKRRVERRYLGQMIKGCGNVWCKNEYCKTAKAKTGRAGAALSTQEALPLVKPLMDTYSDRNAPMYFCVDEGSQKRRKLAEMLAAENTFDPEWCVAAVEAETGNLDGARQWLQNWAPKRL
ncbi:Ubiquitin fusion degradation protein [Lachnellula occidentalis]|uniref:Ubiquitin fusion degradation protein n=1 Tax=Lachnellula occidentalis TaxID=215460 RepID=A0A8H8RSI4_9HELO|nr:Ubiquitin fusion degradation protein [Lachnellula occidentalis]